MAWRLSRSFFSNLCRCSTSPPPHFSSSPNCFPTRNIASLHPLSDDLNQNSTTRQVVHPISIESSPELLACPSLAIADSLGGPLAPSLPSYQADSLNQPSSGAGNSRIPLADKVSPTRLESWGLPPAVNTCPPHSVEFYSATRSPTPSRPLENIQDLQGVLERAPTDVLQTEDGKVLYAGMTSTELLRTLFNLHLVAYEQVVDLSTKLLKSPLMSFSPLRVPILWMVKKTAYSHFCAGEDVNEASTTLQRMWELGLRGILDYSLEDAVDNLSCDSNLQGFLKTIHQTKLLPPGSVSFSCVKMTALVPLHLLERISDLLRWQHKHQEFILPWREEGLSVLAPESPIYHVQSAPDPLTLDEERDLLVAKERFCKLCEECERVGLPLLVDAEYTSVQPAIDYFTYAAAMQFNRSEQPLVYGTIQAYLKDSFARLAVAMDEASKKNVTFGVKLVRGAYLTRESSLASSLGAPSPIHACIEDTHNCYDKCATFMLQQAASGEGAVVLATHNFDSGRAAAAKAEELGLVKGDARLQFSQLKGMADGLSLALSHAGFQVSKYLPFGPVCHVIPYLIRRAEENRGLLGNTTADRHKIRQELKRRCVETMTL